MRRLISGCRSVSSQLKGKKENHKITFRCFAINSIDWRPSLQLDWAPNESHRSGVGGQQVRMYAPAGATSSAAQCWNCKQPAALVKENMICSGCGHLQDVNTEVNYFDLMGLPRTFALDPQILSSRFRQLQTLVHPDKFSNKSIREKSNSADWSALVNRAYKTLSAPIERGQYILKLNGYAMPQDNSALHQEFLMEMMERNEEVEQATSAEDLQQLNVRISEELEQKLVVLGEEFEANALEKAIVSLVEMKYLLSIQNSIKSKLQSLMGTT